MSVHERMNGTSGAPTLLPGFDDPVSGAQATFRAALQALATPGTVHRVEPPRGVPAGLSPAMTAMLLTLADVDAAVWLPPSLGDGARAFLRFHCACPLVDEPAQARFVVVPAGCAGPALEDCDAGEPAYPDRSATMLIEVESLGGGAPLRLSGPGIPDSRSLAVSGLPEGFLGQWAANHGRFPLGVDVFLVQGNVICALPRTARCVLEN